MILVSNTCVYSMRLCMCACVCVCIYKIAHTRAIRPSLSMRLCMCACVCVCIYKIAHTRAIRPSPSMPLALILPRKGDVNDTFYEMCVNASLCVYMYTVPGIRGCEKLKEKAGCLNEHTIESLEETIPTTTTKAICISYFAFFYAATKPKHASLPPNTVCTWCCNGCLFDTLRVTPLRPLSHRVGGVFCREGKPLRPPAPVHLDANHSEVLGQALEDEHPEGVSRGVTVHQNLLPVTVTNTVTITATSVKITTKCFRCDGHGSGGMNSRPPTLTCFFSSDPTMRVSKGAGGLGV